MAYLESSIVGWMLALIPIVGLVSAWLARLNEGSRWQACCHSLFVGCLAVIGLATMGFVAFGTGHWLGSGATLSVMVLAAVWDFRGHAGAASH
jgi:hypothetical protein